MAGQKKEQKTNPKVSPSRSNWLAGKRMYALIVFAFSFLLHFNTLFNDYNLDDELVTQNHQVTSKGWRVLKLNFDAFNSVELQDSSFTQKLKYFMPVVFRVPYYQDKSGFKYEYRPLVFASFALEHALFAKTEVINGLETETESATVSHFINILLYALLCVLLFYTLCYLLRGYNILFPVITTLLFAAYPMHTEVVASIKNRDEILAMMFGLLSLYFSLRFIDSNRLRWLGVVLLFFIAGILSKPTTIIFVLLIPLSLVVFTTCSYQKLFIVAITLIIPAVLFSRLYSAVQQTSLAVILWLAVTGLYILKNRNTFWAKAKTLTSDSYRYYTSTTVNKPTETNDLDFGFLRNPLTLGLVIIAAVLPALVAAFGIYIFNSWVACLPLVFFVILYLFLGNEIKVIFTTSLSLLILFAVVKFFPQSRMIEISLMLFLSVQIFSGQKYFRLVGIANYAIYAIVSVLFLHSYHFLFILFFIGFIHPKAFAATLVVAALSLLLYVKKVFGLFHGHGSWIDGVLIFPVLYLFIFLLWKGWWKRALLTATAIIPIIMIAYFAWIHPAVNGSAYYALQRTYYRVNSIKAADPTPVQSVRPLKFLEYTVNNNDPFSIKVGTSLEVLGIYLKMVIIPYPMSYYYGYSYITPQNISDPIPLMSLLIHLILLGVAIYFFRAVPLLSFSILFYLISIAVFSNLVTPIPGMLGDRFLLIPSLGFCIFVIYMGSTLFKQNLTDTRLQFKDLKMPLSVSLAILLLLYSGITFSRNSDWKDRLTLFRHDIKVVDNSAQAHNLLAVHLFLVASQQKDQVMQKQLREEAIPHFKRALEIYPDFLNASYDLGRTYEALHMNDEALAVYHSTVKLDTNFVAPYFNMGAIMHNKGQYAAAIPLYQKFLTQYPKQIEAYTNLSFAYFKLNDFENSIAVNRKAMEMTGETYVPTVNIAKTFMVMSKPDSALVYWEQAHLMRPNDPGINNTIEQLKAKKP